MNKILIFIRRSPADRYNDAVYAGKFAKMLQSMESKNKNMFIDFISSGFTGNEIPRELPGPMRSLSRIGSIPIPRESRRRPQEHRSRGIRFPQPSPATSVHSLSPSGSLHFRNSPPSRGRRPLGHSAGGIILN